MRKVRPHARTVVEFEHFFIEFLVCLIHHQHLPIIEHDPGAHDHNDSRLCCHIIRIQNYNTDIAGIAGPEEPKCIHANH